MSGTIAAPVFQTLGIASVAPVLQSKTVSPKGWGPEGMILAGTVLEYKIAFTNWTNDTIFNLRIEDTLTSGLDMSTLELGESSHSYQPLVASDGSSVLSFRFASIRLLDSTNNKARSSGFITFRIRTEHNLPYGTQIKNTAHIYFDGRPGSRTTTTLNTVVPQDSIPQTTAILSSKASGALRIKALPNPSQGKFSLMVSSPCLVQVFASNGTLVAKRECEAGWVPMHLTLPAGLYFLEATSHSGKWMERLAIQ